MALIMPPSTSSIISSLPLSKAGVGSAVNDVTREVGGAIGIAVMGSILNSIYTSHIDLGAVAAKVPDAFQAKFAAVNAVASEGIGPANGVAAGLDAQAAKIPQLHAIADGIRSAARLAFVDGTSTAFVVAAGVAMVGGLVVSTRIPNEIAAGQAHG